MSHLLWVQSANNQCLTWYWTSMLRSIDSCQSQNGVSPDQCHMTVSWLQVYNSVRWRVCFLIFSSDQILVFNWLMALSNFFRKNSVCSLFMAKVEFFLKEVSLKIPWDLRFWPYDLVCTYLSFRDGNGWSCGGYICNAELTFLPLCYLKGCVLSAVLSPSTSFVLDSISLFSSSFWATKTCYKDINKKK